MKFVERLPRLSMQLATDKATMIADRMLEKPVKFIATNLFNLNNVTSRLVRKYLRNNS